MKSCKIGGCDQEVKNDSRSGMCHQCSSSLYYWSKKRPAQVLARRGRLQKYTNRLGEFFNDEGKREKPIKRGPRADRRPAHATTH